MVDFDFDVFVFSTVSQILTKHKMTDLQEYVNGIREFAQADSAEAQEGGASEEPFLHIATLEELAKVDWSALDWIQQ